MIFLVVPLTIIICIPIYFIILYFNQKPMRKFLESENAYLQERMGGNRREYALQEKCKKVVLGANKLYIRTQDERLGTIYDCADILDAKIEYRVNNEIVHYEDKYGAARDAFIAGLAGFSLIVDSNSFDRGRDVLEKSLAICVVISMKKDTLVLLAYNEIPYDNASVARAKEVVRFVEDLKKTIRN